MPCHHKSSSTSVHPADGTRAQNFWGLRYIDDLIAQRVQRGTSGGGYTPPDGSWGHEHLSLTLSDSMFSVRQIIGDDWADTSRSKWARERASLEIDYTAYGLPDAVVGLVTDPWAGFDGDGDVDATDTNTFLSLYSATDTKADRNADSAWTFADVQFFLADASAAGATLTPTGRVNHEENPFGLAGYRHDGITGLYHVRNRVLDPEQGKWLQRDPAGFVDGGNHSLYAQASPVTSVDSVGLDSEPWEPYIVGGVGVDRRRGVNLSTRTLMHSTGPGSATRNDWYRRGVSAVSNITISYDDAHLAWTLRAFTEDRDKKYKNWMMIHDTGWYRSMFAEVAQQMAGTCECDKQTWHWYAKLDDPAGKRAGLDQDSDTSGFGYLGLASTQQVGVATLYRVQPQGTRKEVTIYGSVVWADRSNWNFTIGGGVAGIGVSLPLNSPKLRTIVSVEVVYGTYAFCCRAPK